jgi:hypothetical protein
MELENQSLIGETITLKVDDGLVWVGPKFSLMDGRVVLNVRAQDLFFREPCDFINCEVYAKRKLVNFQEWNKVALRKCRITGWFTGNDFGHWESGPVSAGRPEKYGVVEDCDFTGATLDAVRFLNCDMSRIKLPGWPHFTILHPHRLAAVVKSIAWPEKTITLANVTAEADPQESAVVYFAPEMCRRIKCTEANLLEAIKLVESALIN